MPSDDAVVSARRDILARYAIPEHKVGEVLNKVRAACNYRSGERFNRAIERWLKAPGNIAGLFANDSITEVLPSVLALRGRDFLELFKQVMDEGYRRLHNGRPVR